jgi:hypothetical protein
MLAGCNDTSVHPNVNCSTLGQTTRGFGAGPDRRAVGDFLCPGLLAIQQAPCHQLRHVSTLTELISPIAKAPRCCKLGWSGLHYTPHELAAVMVGLAGGHDQAPEPAADRSKRVRVATTKAGNGWVGAIVSTYLQRVSGDDALQGVLVGDGKSEWTHHGDLRMVLKQLGLYYRATSMFEAEDELALLAHDTPGQYRSAIMPASFTKAKALLPKGWSRDAVWPFDACLRADTRYDPMEVLADFRRLAPWCRLTAVWTGPPRPEQPPPQQLAGEFSKAGGREVIAHRVGNFTLLQSKSPIFGWPMATSATSAI